MARHIGTFEGERMQRSRGWRADYSAGQNWSSFVEVICGILLMWVVIVSGFAVLPL